MDLGPWDRLDGEEWTGAADERLCDLFAELLEPHEHFDGAQRGDDDD